MDVKPLLIGAAIGVLLVLFISGKAGLILLIALLVLGALLYSRSAS